MTHDRPLASVFRNISGGSYPPVVETFERSKTIFFPGDPAERVYVLIKGAVKLSRVYEAGDEITVALLRENSVFGVPLLSNIYYGPALSCLRPETDTKERLLGGCLGS